MSLFWQKKFKSVPTPITASPTAEKIGPFFQPPIFFGISDFKLDPDDDALKSRKFGASAEIFNHVRRGRRRIGRKCELSYREFRLKFHILLGFNRERDREGQRGTERDREWDRETEREREREIISTE